MGEGKYEDPPVRRARPRPSLKSTRTATQSSTSWAPGHTRTRGPQHHLWRLPLTKTARRSACMRKETTSPSSQDRGLPRRVQLGEQPDEPRLLLGRAASMPRASRACCASRAATRCSSASAAPASSRSRASPRFVSEMKCFQIELTKGYGINEFREDLKKLYFTAGTEKEHPRSCSCSPTRKS